MIVMDGVSLAKLVIASGNRHKYEEFRGLLAPLGIELLFGGDFDTPIDVEETGTTFVENATLKAAAWAQYAGLPAISDDSGIEVRALGWQPGIYSSRIGGEDDEACRQWLISNMADKTDRFARYAAALVLAFPDGKPHWHTLAYCNGSVIQDKRGTNGFGYDPLFIPEGYDQTFGELPASVKSRISHRAKASQAFIEMLHSLRSR
ncbi:MAG: RdgB/HAM1 family non-canonical purine NTP pyrophosphatase [Pyramidobacter sp.]|nr:RdgB/HAM1 family non-canonical purine NTP pyrophosphatase [Pyramidobacter sp.]